MVKDSQVFDNDGNTMYPIDPRKPMVLDLISVNNGVEYTDNKVKVKILQYQPDWATGECGYTELPTFGLLDNIDGCEFAHNCPLTTGDLDLKLPLDLSGFGAIINTLASDVSCFFGFDIKNSKPFFRSHINLKFECLIIIKEQIMKKLHVS